MSLNWVGVCVYQFRFISLARKIDAHLKKSKRRVGYSMDMLTMRNGKYWKVLREKNKEWYDPYVDKVLEHRVNFFIYATVSLFTLILVAFAFH